MKFILVDAFPADPEGVEESIEVENIYAMQFKEQESGFFAGMAAAYETKSNKDVYKRQGERSCQAAEHLRPSAAEAV